MNDWLETVYADGTEDFVSVPSPRMGQRVTVRLRIAAGAPVRHVLVRSVHNGAEKLTEATSTEVRRGLRWYEAELDVNEPRIQYQYYIVCDDVVYFYTQRGLTTYVPDHTYDFVLLAEYVQPAWVKDAVFYQIFPERFCNGDPANDVRTGEYAVGGRPCVRVEDWNARPTERSRERGMDFFGGDLQGVRQKLPYLKELGVTALYLNPIFTAPSTHKYDCADYLHVDPHFGGDQALADLTRAAHELGMRVILDISINHTGSAHRWFNRDPVYFPASEGAYSHPDSPERAYYFFRKDNSYLGWAGYAGLPTLNYTSQELRDAIYRGPDAVLRKWLRPPYSIDGWRFDVADVFARNDELQLAHELWPQIRRAIREENPQAYILAEDWGDCAQYLQGDEWDAPMNYFGCGRPIRQFMGKPDLFMERCELLRDVPYKMTAADLAGRVTEHFAKLPWVIGENQFNLFDSHDVSRLHNCPTVTPDMVRGAVIFQFLLPGAACIYYGDEAAIGGTEESDAGCRWPMPWGSGFEERAQYALYRTMAHLKADHTALRRGGMKFLAVGRYAFALARFTWDEAFVGVISNSDDDEVLRVPFAAIGAAGPAGERDVFGEPLRTEGEADGGLLLRVPAGKSFLIRCRMRE